MREERIMLIVNDDHLCRAGVKSLDEPCPYCSKALAEYPLIMSDESEQVVYHAACALQLATEILVPRDAQRDAHVAEVPPQAHSMLALFWQGSQKYLCLIKVRAPRSVLSSHGIDELHLVAQPVGG